MKEGFPGETEETDRVKCVENLLTDKQAMARREKKLIVDLNAALEKMGYRVVSTKGGGGETPKKPGRPPRSGKVAAC